MPQADDLRSILDIQRSAFERDGTPDVGTRRADLAQLKAAIRGRKRDLIAAVAADFGRRSAEETLILELGQIVQTIGFLSHGLKRWTRPEQRFPGLNFLPGRAEIRVQPKGVIGIVAPWNYPYLLSLAPLATALAAGNRAMVKPSELAPESGQAIASLIADTFPSEKATAILGGVDTGAAFAGLPFDHLFFTGSTTVGRKVMRAAAENLVPVTLELGGKSPVIIGPDGDIAKSARDVAFGKLANSGQTCIAPDYALVHEDVADAFVSQLVVEMDRILPGAPHNPAQTTIISDNHAARLRDLLADAQVHGGRLIPMDAGDSAGRSVRPVVVDHVNDAMRLMQEEIFGPILAIVRYTSLDDAIAYVAARPHPLALYYYGRDKAVARRVLDRTKSGNAAVNGVMTQIAVSRLPFGGIGPSGMGAYHGREGFLAMSHAKSVYYEPRHSLVPLGRAPGGRFAKLVARYLMW